MDDLFPTAIQKSPRLLWLERHGLSMLKTDTGWRIELDADSWVEDDNQDDVCWAFCRKFGIKHWLQLT